MSLVEAMAGAFVLSVGILGMASLLTQSQQLTRHAEQTHVAFVAAQERLEDLREYSRLNFDRVRDNFDGVGFDVMGLTAVGEDPDGLPGMIRIEPVDPNDPTSRLLDVAIDVEFEGVSGARVVTMETRLAPR
jgi:hypothetical protein